MNGRRTGTYRVPALTRSSVLLAGILLLAGFVDGLSDNWVHGAVLGAAAAAVCWDGAHRPDRQTALLRRELPAAAAPALAASALVYVVAVGTLDPYTWPVTLAVVAPGVGALVLAWLGPLRPRPVPARLARRAVSWWAVVFVGGGLWELGALLLQPSLGVGSYAHPTISYLMDSVLATWPGRSLTLAGWLALGWFLLLQATGEPG